MNRDYLILNYNNVMIIDYTILYFLIFDDSYKL